MERGLSRSIVTVDRETPDRAGLRRRGRQGSFDLGVVRVSLRLVGGDEPPAHSGEVNPAWIDDRRRRSLMSRVACRTLLAYLRAALGEHDPAVSEAAWRRGAGGVGARRLTALHRSRSKSPPRYKK